MSTVSAPSLARRLCVPLIALAVVATVLWLGCEWLVRRAQVQVKESLAARGLLLTSKSESWSLWGGVTLQDAVLSQVSGNRPPLLQISALHVEVEWGQSWEHRSAITRWLAEDAVLTLQDEVGAVTLNPFTLDSVVREGQVDVARLRLGQGALTVDVKGEVLTSTTSEQGGDKTPFSPDWQSLRSVFRTLSFNPEAGPFQITGVFAVDLRNSAVIWNADLQGTGQHVEWRGVPLKNAMVEGQVSQGGLRLTGDFQFTQGSALIEMSREGWSQTPLNLSGTLTDSANRSDEFEAAYLGSQRTLTIARLSGPADLLELAQNYPLLAAQLPSALTVKTFPDILAKDFVLDLSQEPPVWTLASAQLRTPASIVVTVRDQPLTMDGITGQVSRKKDLWHFNDLKGKLLDGRFKLDANYDGRILTDAQVSLQSLRLARLTPWLGKINDSLEDSDLSLNYQGTICNNPVRSTGGGSLILTNAPVVHIPLLEQTYALFPKLLPDRGRAGAGQFQVTFSMNKGVATIDPFKGRSEAITVTATGTVDLVNQYVQGRARANLRGIVGRITLPLSHVFTDMEISGPLDDIRVSPEGPIGGAKGLFQGTAKVAKGSVKLSGNVLKEGLTLPFEALGMFGEQKAGE
ncbi:AsmA-like C-terminal region-containing protein [Prosthecobacter dejongeii]|uniref:AsmA-like C-terminal region n=1 Tax=Prosthecobacter dejongeii TaxID=48465 RepID=A0A7W7YQ87_9BACT|nr:AsmA-like C-terminal region-containing protein [Prosthecobacter dejongeii]MBB5040222.1 hypothetical protein [Prosthecobacter dejongeii]